MLKVGDKAPDFKLPTSEGKQLSLSDLRGGQIVLYFYPKDDTSGCTMEACSFQESLGRLTKKGAVVVGVSADTVSSHAKFAEKLNLTFPLLSDEARKVIKAYGVWKKKSMSGRKFMGIERTTFVIDQNGIIKRIFPKVKVEGHVEEVLGAL